MRPFAYERATNVAQAAKASSEPGVRLLAGGTNLIDLMKVGAEAPSRVVDINGLPLKAIEAAGEGLRIGALATNSQIAADPRVREHYPVLARAILSGASAQLRNKATAGGNLMQRVRCPYFYDAAQPCNQRTAGSGCSALEGFNRGHAILGWDEACVAVSASDMAVALVALGAEVEAADGAGTVRRLLVGELPLPAGEIITAIELPAPPEGPQHWRKVRDRASYAGALVTCARVGDRYALGGVALKPWRCVTLEAALAAGESAASAIEAELAHARALSGNGFKIELARRLLAEAVAPSTASRSPSPMASPQGRSA